MGPAEVTRRKAMEHAKLFRMVAYADAAGCLRATILRYFGDHRRGSHAARVGTAIAAPRSTPRHACS